MSYRAQENNPSKLEEKSDSADAKASTTSRLSALLLSAKQAADEAKSSSIQVQELMSKIEEQAKLNNLTVSGAHGEIVDSIASLRLFKSLAALARVEAEETSAEADMTAQIYQCLKGLSTSTLTAEVNAQMTEWVSFASARANHASRGLLDIKNINNRISHILSNLASAADARNLRADSKASSDERPPSPSLSSRKNSADFKQQDKQLSRLNGAILFVGVLGLLATGVGGAAFLGLAILTPIVSLAVPLMIGGGATVVASVISTLSMRFLTHQSHKKDSQPERSESEYNTDDGNVFRTVCTAR